MDSRLSRFTHASSERAIRVSFEFLRPKTADMERSLWEAIGRLAPLLPYFVSVTYGAGGSTRERTHATVKRILTETMLTPAAHLTCVAATRTEVDAVIEAYARAATAYRRAAGDPLGGIGDSAAHRAAIAMPPISSPGTSASPRSRLPFRLIRKSTPTAPVSPPTSTCSRPKSDAGATRAITQFFFENSLYFRYLDRVQAPASTSRSCRASCRCRISSGLQFRGPRRRFGAQMAGCAFRRPR